MKKLRITMKISDEEFKKRLPLKPHILMLAQQNPIHCKYGDRARAAKTARVPRVALDKNKGSGLSIDKANLKKDGIFRAEGG